MDAFERSAFLLGRRRVRSIAIQSRCYLQKRQNLRRSRSRRRSRSIKQTSRTTVRGRRTQNARRTELEEIPHPPIELPTSEPTAPVEPMQITEPLQGTENTTISRNWFRFPHLVSRFLINFRRICGIRSPFRWGKSILGGYTSAHEPVTAVPDVDLESHIETNADEGNVFIPQINLIENDEEQQQSLPPQLPLQLPSPQQIRELPKLLQPIQGSLRQIKPVPTGPENQTTVTESPSSSDRFSIFDYANRQ